MMNLKNLYMEYNLYLIFMIQKFRLEKNLFMRLIQKNIS